MKVVQNNSYWRDLLENTPQLLLVFRVDEQEKTELVFANKQITEYLGFKAEEYVMHSVQHNSLKSELDNLVDKLAQHSRGEIKDSDCVIELSNSTGDKIPLYFVYEAYKPNSSQYFHLSVVLSKQVILPSLKSEQNIKKTDFIAESMVMKALIERLPSIIDTQQAIVVQGEQKTGKTKLIEYMLSLPSFSFWRVLHGFAQLKTDEIEAIDKTIVVIDHLDSIDNKDQQILLNYILKASELGATVKIIGSTTVSMDKLLESGKFIPELYYKLVAYTLHLPSLRFRKEDVQFYLNSKKESLRETLNKAKLEFSPECLSFFNSTDWKQNFTSVQEFVESMISYVDDEIIELPEEYRIEDGDQSSLFEDAYPELLSFDKMQANYLKEVLKVTGGKIYGKGGAAQVLKLKPTTLQSKLKKLGIK